MTRFLQLFVFFIAKNYYSNENPYLETKELWYTKK